MTCFKEEFYFIKLFLPVLCGLKKENRCLWDTVSKYSEPLYLHSFGRIEDLWLLYINIFLFLSIIIYLFLELASLSELSLYRYVPAILIFFTLVMAFAGRKMEEGTLTFDIVKT